MTTSIIYCLNGCTRRHGDEYLAVTTEGRSQLCTQCEARMHGWLMHVPETYALVPLFIEHGTTTGNPESKATKGSTAQAPMRLDAIDLLDERRGRMWDGLAPTTDRRGVIGILKPWVELLCDERPLTNVTSITVTTACDLLDRHRLWVAEQEWVADLYDDLKRLNRTLSDAIGDYRQKPFSNCPVLTENGECGGPMFANPLGGAHCARCRETWDINDLARLGLVLNAATA